MNHSEGVVSAQANKMYALYEKWPDYFREAMKVCCSVDHDSEFYTSAVFCGMGGSATQCDILNELMHAHGTIPSVALKRESVPNFVNNHSLVVVNSVSGNTKEALQMARKSVEKGAETICISSGGLLEDFAADHGLKHVRIPNLHVPRASLPYLLVPGIQLIDSLLVKSVKEELASIARLLEVTRSKVSSDIPEEFNMAKKVSTFLRNGLAMCFSSPSLYPAAKRLKNSLNENAKLYCFRESVLEGSHNGIVPFTYNYEIDCKPVLLQWDNDEKMIRDRFETLKHLFGEIGQTAIEVNAPEYSLLLAIVNTIYVLDYSTVYLALTKKIDPSPTPAIDILKKLETG